MELLELTKIMFEKPEEYSSVTPGDKRKHFFMINRRMSIQHPEEAQALQRLKINEAAVVDFWQRFLIRKYKGKTPFWMFIAGVKKKQEEKEKKINIKESVIKQYAIKFGYDLKSVREAIEIFPDSMKKELQNFEKILES